MRYLFLVFAVFLASCSGGESKSDIKSIKQRVASPPPPPPVLVSEATGFFSSWWEIPQYYNGVPKYSGPFGTYTHKHIPLAVYANGSLFHVRTDNTEDDNFRVYVMKDDQEVLIHQIDNWNDPHTNAAINVLPSGHVKVHIASRGLAHKFQSGKIFISQTPYELDFECIDGCENINYEAYPQVHNTDWGEHLIYTLYETEPGSTKSYRRSWSRVGNVRQKLSNREHYQISYYDDVSKTLCVARNLLFLASPDYRFNLWLMCTSNGSTWFNNNGTMLNVPVEYDGESIVYNSTFNSSIDQDHYYVYLKDIIKHNGKWRVLFARSESADPTQGNRTLMEWVEGVGVSKVTSVGHNYSAGAYLVKGFNLYIAAGISTAQYYLSGDVQLFDTNYNLIDSLNTGEYSYVRRVRGIDGLAVMSKGQSDLQSRGEHYKLILD